MTTQELKKIMRLLKEAYKEMEEEALAKDIDIFSDEYKQIIDKARIIILEKLGFTLEQYREAKDKYGIVKNLDKEAQETTSKRITDLLDTHIPDIEEIEDISNKVSKKYIKPPQVTNQIV